VGPGIGSVFYLVCGGCVVMPPSPCPVEEHAHAFLDARMGRLAGEA